MRVSSLKVGHKLIVVIAGVILIAFVIAAIVIARIGNYHAEKSAEEVATAINLQVVNTVDVFTRELESSADRLLGALNFGFPERFRIEEGAPVRIGERTVPSLFNGARLVNQDFAFVDRFGSNTRSVATVFVRDNADFVRITTSLKKEDGTRAIGTTLDHKHPAYAKLMAGENYRGVARLFGRDYFTKYQPIKEGGKVIGVLFIGVDFTEALVKLKERLRTVKVGDTGYVFIIDARAGDASYGQFVIHPVLEGKNSLEIKNSRGKPIFREMLDKGQGTYQYIWQRANADHDDDVIAALAKFDEFGWLIVTRADIEELAEGALAIEHVVLIVGLLLLVGLPLLAWLAVGRLVAQPLGRLQAYCVQVEKDLDFTLPPPVHGGDEVGQTTEAMIRLLNTLRQAFHHLLGNVQRVDEASRAMAATSRESAQNSGQASDAASAMAASIEELSVGINHISDNASEAARLSREAGERSQQGGRTILDANSEMNAIAERVGATSDAITALGEESRQISGIVSVIKEVAEQTNLLALNAAIEAARAGEAGRGFAVVADEVRKLAERTTHATSEIAGVIGSIQQRANQAVSVMAEAVAQVERGKQLAMQAGEAIAEIRNSSESVVDVVRQITDSLGESSAASQNIANQTERVAHVAEESDHAAKMSAESAGNLENLTRDMRQTVSRFRI